MDRYTRLFTNSPFLGLKLFRRNVKLRHVRKTPDHMKNISKNIELALEHYDGLYSRVYGKQWPSMRLGLLSPRKYCAVLNTFIDENNIPENTIDVQDFYAKRLKFLEMRSTKKADATPAADQLDLNQTEVNQSETVQTNHCDSENSVMESSDELISMFRETSLDDENRPFFNQASTNISLKDYVPTSELIFHENVPSDPIFYEGTIRDVDQNIQMIDHPPLSHQEHLKILTFPRGNWSHFESPNMVPKASLFSYYLLDGASVLPVLILEPKFDDICADYCSAPGGKSIALLMTLKPKYLLCNDSSQSRLKRLHTAIKQYIPDINYAKSTLNFSSKDSRKMVYPDTFDKILVDVPCSNDRTSVESIENNLFKRSRTEERLSLPSKQCDILKSALKSLKCGGDVVYSTCTMSPLENDNVVKRSLLQLREEGYQATYAVMNLRDALKPLDRLFAFNRKFIYGQQVVPNVCSNFGPMYMSKIRRIS